MPEEPRPKTEFEKVMERRLETMFGSYRSSTFTSQELRERDQYQAQQIYLRDKTA